MLETCGQHRLTRLWRVVDVAGTSDGELAGFVVGITADRRWDEQAELLRRRGAAVLHGPTIRTLPLAGSERLRAITEELILDPPSHLLANTGLGLRSWFGAAENWGLGDALLGALSESRIVARGPKASAVVHQLGLDVAYRAPSERLSEAVDLLVSEGLGGTRVAFQRHGDESPEVVAQLTAAGADVVEVPIYRWTLPDDESAALRLISAVVSGRVDAITFTSAPALRNLFDIAERNDVERELRRGLAGGVVAACVGPVCVEAAHECGIVDVVVPDRFRIGPLVRTLTERLTANAVEVELCGKRYSLRGAGLVTDDGVVTLAARELALLRYLAARRPAVVAKTELLRSLWPDDAHDGHAIEVTVARLRKRLGPLGSSIIAVPKRGYALA